MSDLHSQTQILVSETDQTSLTSDRRVYYNGYQSVRELLRNSNTSNVVYVLVLGVSNSV